MNREAAKAGKTAAAATLDSPPCSAPATAPRPRSAGAARQLQMDVRASDSTEQMGSIMRLIEQLEKQAVEEARQVAPAPPQAVAVASAAVPASAAEPAQHPMARVLAAQPLTIASRKALAAAANDAAAAQAVQAAASCRVARKSAQLLGELAGAGASTPAAPAACLSKTAAPMPGPEASASAPAAQVNAAAVASSVRAKIQQLQQQVAEKDGQLAALRQQVAALPAQQEAALRAAADGHKVGQPVAQLLLLPLLSCLKPPPPHSSAANQQTPPGVLPLQAQLAAHKAEAEASACRSMQFIDRIMAEKDALSGKSRQGVLHGRREAGVATGQWGNGEGQRRMQKPPGNSAAAHPCQPPPAP